MTSNQQLLERVPTDSSSNYLQAQLRGVFMNLLEHPAASFDDMALETNDDILSFCHAGLILRYRAAEKELLSAEAEDDVKSGDSAATEDRLGNVYIREANAWNDFVNFEALKIANGIAEYSESAENRDFKDYFLQVIGMGKTPDRNEGKAIYAELWQHLNSYAHEQGGVIHFNSDFGQGLARKLQPHFETLPVFEKDKPGLLLATVGRTSIFGSLAGQAISPSLVNLTLEQS